jgi:predicted ATP-grasp superfamily ATP-dependent carboligase
MVGALAQRRPLWGNDRKTLKTARSPQAVARMLEEAGLPHPPVHLDAADVPRRGSWLVKPITGSGGRGIARWDGEATTKRPAPVYYQQYIQGEPCAAVYVGDGQRAALLGVTRQLIGEPWLHAAAFQYCGSIGPLRLKPDVRQRFEQLGNVLAAGCGLRGLFGVDAIRREGVPWPVEVNPRYTASVEVLEYATGVAALDQHLAAFYPASGGRERPNAGGADGPRSPCVGKAILFARDALIFPRDGPWSAALQTPGCVHELPAFADLPHGGQRFHARQPVLTCFAGGDTPSDCLDRLRQIALDLDRRLRDA